ncbi:FapA family protein [Maridesulfovibrio sp.]|uniref:FapA family protein n=1 Tax=Maridesulfovibrio sp. TaxID=2795000 RepID=UPI002AA92046|nr:FapA family protein [Maridesulfovibrio sp.]
MTEQDNSSQKTKLRNMEKRTAPEDRNATLEFKLTHDKMAAFISAYTPAEGNGSTLSLELMKAELERSGIRGELDHDGAMFALKRSAEGKSIINVALVRALYPQNAVDGQIITDADLNFPVLPGMEFGRLSEAVPASPGKNLYGEEIPAEDTHTPTPLDLAPDSNCSLDAETGKLTAKTYGLVRITDHQVSIEPLIIISSDMMSVKTRLYPYDCFSMRYDLGAMEKVLEGMGITRPLQHVVGQTAIKKARETGEVQEAVIVTGTEPIPGQDGYFEYAREDKAATSIGTTGEDDRVDFKDRGVHPMVGPGDVIGKIHPPVEGKSGEDVYGRLTPPPGGNPLEIKTGAHVAPMPDGITYKATSTGIVHFQDNTLAVKDVLETKGDVDYSTGNIKLEKGSVHVNGSIREGFTVEAPAHVVVADSIEGSKVTAGGDVEVKGGLVMAGKGVVKAAGIITAQFASNAHIECGDEIIIKHEISNCLIRCKGPVSALGGKGIIQGGVVTSEVSIEANEIGSEIGVKTVVGITAKQKPNTKLSQERDALRARLLKINSAIGQGDDESIIKGTPPAKLEQMKQILMLRGRIKIKLKEIRKQLSKELNDYYKSLERLSIRVHRKIHPGVEIKIGGKTVQISKPTARMKFRFDADERTIIATKL